MFDAFNIITYVAGFIGFLVVLIAIVTAAQVFMFSKAKLQPFDVPRYQGDRRIAATHDAHMWAKGNEFEFIGYYTMLNAFIATWRRNDRPTFFCQYQVQHKIVYDLATEFDPQLGLTTGSSADGHFFPNRPGHYMQTFSKLSLDEQWDRHIEAENFLIERGGIELVARDLDFEQIFIEAIHAQMQFVRSIFLWPLRGAYWFGIRRFQWHNRTIADLHAQHKISLPNQTLYNLNA